MSTTPEERRQSHEEENTRIDAGGNRGQEEMTVSGLQRNAAAALSYLGGWITGVVFLVLEQKNQFVRFHAAQSIVVFGFLHILSAALHPIPFVGQFFNIVVGVAAFVLWIVLMVKAGQGELFMLPVASDLAWRLLGRSPENAAGHAATPGTGPASVPAAKAADRVPRRNVSNPDAGRGSRTVASAFAIAWSVALIVFLNFFNQYIAYYHLEQVAGQDTWLKSTILTDSFATWLPVVNIVLAFTILGHILLLAIDKYVVRETVLLALDLFNITSVTALLSIFPFDFSVFGDVLAGPLDLGIHLTLAFVILGLAISALVRFIKIVVNLVRGTASY
jgi:uncharacterized membrane protein